MYNSHGDAHWSGVIFGTGTAPPFALGKEELNWRSPEIKQLLAEEFFSLSNGEMFPPCSEPLPPLLRHVPVQHRSSTGVSSSHTTSAHVCNWKEKWLSKQLGKQTIYRYEITAFQTPSSTKKWVLAACT